MSRYHDSISYPKLAYAEMAVMFFGANFVYHRNVFRRNQLKLPFFGFLLINGFTAWSLTEATNPAVAKYYAAAYNNQMESEH